jgi:penicillin-binding protein 1A
VLRESKWTLPYALDLEPEPLSDRMLPLFLRLDRRAIGRRMRLVLARGRALWGGGLARVLAPPTAALCLVGALGLHHVYLDRGDLPDLEAFVRFEPPAVGAVYDARGDVLIELAREYRRIVRYEDLPPVVQNAILSAEDKGFFEHGGVDYTALPRVVWKTFVSSISATAKAMVTEGRLRPTLVFPQGGSTLTQQLVRGYFLEGMTRRERTDELVSKGLVSRAAAAALGIGPVNKLSRKIEEVRLSLWIEQELARRYGSRRRAKEEILARYASFVYMGSGRHGFAAASEYYFGRPLASLTEREAADAALLAGITKSPRDYAPAPGHLRRAQRRRDQILALMVRNGFLHPERAQASMQQPVRLAAREQMKTEAPAAVDSVLVELKHRSDDPRLTREALFDGRIQVHSTVDNRIQQIVNDALEEGLRLYETRHPEEAGLVQGSVVVLRNGDARILAEAGGRRIFRERFASYNDYNRVTEALRQPGSVMKPLVYLTAFRSGVSLDSVVADEPVAIPMGHGQAPKWVQNYDRKFKGNIRVRQALAESRNAVAVRLAQRIGVSRIMETARELGIRTPLAPYITTALGASEVRLLELATAYRAMASGIVADPYIIERVTDPYGKTLYVAEQRTELLDADDTALREIQEGLRGVVMLPGGTAHSLAASSFPVAVMGKTGTTSEFRDALFVGSTYGPDGITVAVRVGYDDNRALGEQETGGRTALPIFRRIMLDVYGRALLGPAPRFPEEMERHIGTYAAWASARPAEMPALVETAAAAAPDAAPGESESESDLPAPMAPAAPAAPAVSHAALTEAAPAVPAVIPLVIPAQIVPAQAHPQQKRAEAAPGQPDLQ